MHAAALLLVFGLVSIVGGRLLASRAAAETHRRGARLVVQRRARRKPLARGWFPPSGLTIAGVAVQGLDETKHFKLIGTTGTGKSTAIRELLGGALARGDRAIVTDPDGAKDRSGSAGSAHGSAWGRIALSSPCSSSGTTSLRAPRWPRWW